MDHLLSREKGYVYIIARSTSATQRVTSTKTIFSK